MKRAYGGFDGAQSFGVDLQLVYGVEKVVAGGAADFPLARSCFALAQDLFHHNVDRAA